MRDKLGTRLLRAIWEVFMCFSLVLSHLKYISKFIQETLTFESVYTHKEALSALPICLFLVS